MTTVENNPAPTSPETERAALGAMILDNQKALDAQQRLSGSEFSLDSNRRIYAAISDLVDAGKEADIITISEVLRSRQSLEAVGGVAYIASLTDGVAARTSIATYLAIIREKATLRRLIAATHASMAAAYDGGTRSDRLISTLEEQLFQLRSGRDARSYSAHEAVMDMLNEMAAQREHDGRLLGLSTGISSIDYSTTGYREGEFWVWGARPGAGKTSVLVQGVAANAVCEVPVGVFSLEMTRSQIMRRLHLQISELPGLNSARMRDPRSMPPEMWEHLQEISAKVATWPLYIDDSATIEIRELVARAKVMIRRHGVKLIFVDYLQLVKAQAKERREQVGKAAEALRALAKQEHVTVVALSQLSRAMKGRENDAPNLSDLKESGDIEANAHCAVLLHRPLDENRRFSGEDYAYIAKQREGAIGPEELHYLQSKLMFVERTR